MKIFDSLAISGSALTAEKLRLDIISNNLANINTTRTPEGGPYRRQVPLFAENLKDAGFGRAYGRTSDPGGVRVRGIVHDPTDPKLVYEPDHPDANEEGYVEMPNIDMVKEMVDMITATRSYEANVTALNAAKNMFLKALEIGRG